MSFLAMYKCHATSCLIMLSHTQSNHVNSYIRILSQIYLFLLLGYYVMIIYPNNLICILKQVTYGVLSGPSKLFHSFTFIGIHCLSLYTFGLWSFLGIFFIITYFFLSLYNYLYRVITLILGYYLILSLVSLRVRKLPRTTYSYQF